MKFEYETVDASTLAGLERAEKLHEDGWTTDRVGLYLIWFSRKVEEPERR